MSGVDTRNAGLRFGHLTVAYSVRNGRNIACRCVCSKLVHVALEDLAAGLVTSCGCQPASPEFWEQYTALRALQRREISFNTARVR